MIDGWIILSSGSHPRYPEYAANLYRNGYAKWLVLSLMEPVLSTHNGRGRKQDNTGDLRVFGELAR